MIARTGIASCGAFLIRVRVMLRIGRAL